MNAIGYSRQLTGALEARYPFLVGKNEVAYRVFGDYLFVFWLDDGELCLTMDKYLVNRQSPQTGIHRLAIAAVKELLKYVRHPFGVSRRLHAAPLNSAQSRCRIESYTLVDFRHSLYVRFAKDHADAFGRSDQNPPMTRCQIRVGSDGNARFVNLDEQSFDALVHFSDEFFDSLYLLFTQQ